MTEKNEKTPPTISETDQFQIWLGGDIAFLCMWSVSLAIPLEDWDEFVDLVKRADVWLEARKEKEKDEEGS